MRRLLVLGLGNPGLAYLDTRHNVGFSFLDALAERLELSFSDKGNYVLACSRNSYEGLLLCKPMTFMNASGRVLIPLQARYRLCMKEELLVVTDNVDLPVGRVRLKVGASASTHNGLRSINKELGAKPYARLLVGVGLPPAGRALASWVLSRFSEEEKQRLNQVFSFLVETFIQIPGSWDELRQVINSFR